MNDFELDHLFIGVPSEAPGLEQLLALGLVEGSGNTHPGQGTANRRLFFHNVMLEFLWVTDETEARSTAIRRTLLAERCDPNGGACPFGVCLRSADGSDRLAPFETWPFRPPYLPPDVAIPVATNAARLDEPFIFTIPFGGRPDQAPPEKRQPLDHPAGLCELTGVTMSLTQSGDPSPALSWLTESGILTVAYGPAYLIELEFDQATQQRTAALTPGLPLALRW